jgi:membrane protease YdiL (CAAX protease family)
MAEGSALSDAGKPFDLFATLLIGAFALLASQLSGIVVLSGWYGLRLGEVATLTQNGGALILFIFVSAPVQVALLALAARSRGSVAEYLGYKLPRPGEVIVAMLAVAALIAVGDAASWLAGRNIVDRFQSDMYQAAKNADLLPLLLVAITVLIPIGEETLFRGFLFRGWLRTPGDAWRVIVFTAGLFAIIHVQYDWFLIAQVFAFGLLFGWVRWASGSTILTMVMHGLVNLEGLVETMLTYNG